MLFKRLSSSQSLTFVLVLSILVTQSYSRQTDAHFVSSTKVEGRSSEVKASLFSSVDLNEIDFESLMKVFEVPKDRVEIEASSITSFCYGAEFYKQLPRSILYVIMTIEHEPSKEVTVCSNRGFSAYHLTTDIENLEKSFELARDLINSFEKDPKNVILFITSQDSRKLATDPACDPFFYSNNGECESCTEGCQECSDSETCTTCFEGTVELYSYWKDQQGVCNYCNWYECLTCVNDDVCGVCMPGYYKTADNDCLQCEQSDCVECNAAECLKCSKGHYLENGECLSCTWGCEECIDGDSCNTCEGGTFFDATEKYCDDCSDGCYSCTSYSSCQQCYQGYFTGADGCDSCPWYCADCDNPDACTLCYPGQYLNGDSMCVPCSDFYCETCENDMCTQCSEGTFFNPEIEKCSPCSKGCEVCDNTGACLQCSNGPVVEGECLQCGTNCTKCDADQCYKCDDRFYLVDGERDCQPCQPGCASCDDGESCNYCENDFYEHPDDKRCVPCSNGCSFCYTFEQCDYCYEGFFRVSSDNDPETFYCDPCPPNCIYCVDKDTCDVCEEGYTPDDTGKCDSCGKGCAQCENGVCQSCLEGFYYEGTHCVQCSYSCKWCLSYSECQDCEDGFYLDRDIGFCYECDSYCKKCNADMCFECEEGLFMDDESSCQWCTYGCQECKNEETCDLCFEGYYLEESDMSCRDCMPNCRLCRDDRSCGECYSGFYFNENKCIRCGEGCYECDYNGDCISCWEGTYLEDGICLNCLEGCVKCLAKEECNACNYTLYLDQDTMSCKQCMSNCEDCYDDISCSRCSPGFYVDETNPDDISCMKCSDNCEYCYEATCYSCSRGYYVDSDNTCASCPDNCAYCYTYEENSVAIVECTWCEDGYGKSDDECVECPDNCEYCEDGECTSCMSGYYSNENGLCDACVSNCVECYSSDFCYSCEEGYEVDWNTGLCTGCKKNCMNCDSTKFCIQCYDGYYVSETGECLTCSYLCISCTESVCLECESGLYVDTYGKCSYCDYGCAYCESSTICSECESGYYLDVVSKTKAVCVSCGRACSYCDETDCLDCEDGFYLDSGLCFECSRKFPGCYYCTSATECDKCDDGLKLSADGQSCKPCSEGCLYCYDDLDDDNNEIEVCYYCNTSYALVDNECIKCSVGCLYCYDPDYCESCLDYFYLDSSGYCRKCLDNCLYCEDSFTCNECDAGFSWNKQKRQCIACSSGCSDCSEGYCSSCFMGLYLEDKTKSCKYCAPNCIECSSLAFCITCDTGFYFDEDESKCLPCAENCYECYAANQCIYCYEGFASIDGDCQACTSNCASCDSYGCSYCYEGYYLNDDGVCIQCGDNCLYCTSDGCNQCYAKYYLDSSSLECEQCAVDNCYYCDDSTCYWCDYGFTKIDDACVQCPSNCDYCEDPNECIKCVEGYFADSDGVCNLCSDPGCYWCSSDDLCEYCHYGYTLDAYEGKCVACPDFCDDCNSDGSCNRCQDGAFPDQKTGKCFMCPDYCAKCKSYTHCDECASNYIQNMDGSCTPCMRDCLECETKDTCLLCDYGTYLDASNKCKQCDYGCFQCESNERCYECEYGFFLNEDRCKQCTDPVCLICDQDICTECYEGFYLNTTDSTCRPCSDNCLECTDPETCSYCAERFYLDTTLTCSKCAANCLECPDSLDCYACDVGYLLNEDTQPRKCKKCPFTDCQECTLDECLQCNIGFYLNEAGKCVACGGNCAECQFKGICNMCFDGFYIDSSATCKSCPVYCSKCKDGKTCDECSKGYNLQPDLSCSGCPKGCSTCDDSNACYSCLESFMLEGTTCSKCSIPVIVKASINKSYTSLSIEFVSPIDQKPLNCKSAVSTSDSFGTNWNCTVSGKNLTVNFDTDYQLSDASIIFVSTDLVFVKPCYPEMTYNFTAKFQAVPPAPKGQLKGTPSSSLSCSDGQLEYVLDGVGGTAGMMPKIKWSAKIVPDDASITSYVSNLNGTRIFIPTKIFTKVDSNLTVTAEIMNPMKKSFFTSFMTKLFGSKKITVVLDAGTEVNYTTSKDYSFTAKIDNACGADTSISFTWNLTYTTNPNYELGQVETVVPHRLRIPENYLEPFHYYVYTVTATAGSLTGSASVKIYGLAEDLVVVLNRKNGNISPLMDLVVDASESYDPNQLGYELSYSWSCVDPESNKTCTGADGKTLVSAENSAVLNISASRLPAGKFIQLIISIRSSGDTRKSEDSVTFYVYEGLSTNIMMTFSDKKVESSYFFYLDAAITSQAEYTLKWTQVQGSELSLVPDDMPSLFFTPKTFNEGETYEFLLTATEDLTGAFATASVQFKANVPASCLNSLSISSEKGVALTDVFTLSIDSCSDGDEEDTPLTYTFFIIPTDFGGVYITKPQQFSSVDFMIFEGTFIAGVRVCDQLWGCTWKFLDTFFYVSEYQGRRLADDPIEVYKTLVESSSDATILYGISIINTFELTADQVDYVCGDASDYAQTEEVDLDTVEMMLKLYIQTVMNQGTVLTQAKIQEYLDDLVGLVSNCTEDLSSDIMDSFKLLGVEIMKLEPSNLDYVAMVNTFFDEVFETYSAKILPGNVIANYDTNNMIYYKFREVGSGYSNKTISLDGDVSVKIESLPFEDTDLIDINIKTFSDPDQFSDMLEITFTKSGTYINKVLQKTSEEVVALSTPTVLFELPRHKNATGTWTCQYYTNGNWKNDGCEFESENNGVVQMRISHTSLFRLYDSDLVSSSDDGSSSRHYGPVILTGLITLVLLIGYTATRFIDKYDRKKHQKIAVEVNKKHEKHDSDVFEKVEGKENDSSIIETTRKPENQFIKYHLVFGIFTYDSRFTKSDRILAFCLILATQFTLEGALIGYTAIDIEWVSTMVAVAVIAVVLTIPLHVVVNLNLRHISGRLCRAATVLGFIGFIANVALTVAIAVDLTSRHTTWIISFFWGLLFEFILEGIFMVSKYVISKA